MRTMTAGILAALLFMAIPIQARAAEEGEAEYYIRQQLEAYDMEEVERDFSGLFPEYVIDTDRMLSLILEGKILEAGSVFAEGWKAQVTGEMGDVKTVLISILVIGIVSALFSNFSDLFSGKQAAGTGFYFLYLSLMAVLTRTFVFLSQTAVELMENLVLFVKMFVPTWFVAVGMASGEATASFYYQIMLLAAYLIESFLLAGLVPFVYGYVILALMNGIWAEERLSLLLDFIKKGIVLALKLVVGIITGLGMVQAVIVPVVDRLKITALRKAVLAIPGVGGAAEGVAELVLGSAVLIKNSMGVLLLLLLVGACLLPLLKILTVAGVVKLSAALAGIVSDKRIAECADRVGEGGFLLLRCALTSVALFVIVIGVVAYTV